MNTQLIHLQILDVKVCQCLHLTTNLILVSGNKTGPNALTIKKNDNASKTLTPIQECIAGD